MGSKYNVLVSWESGEQTYEPLTTWINVPDNHEARVAVAIYAKQPGLLDTEGWKDRRIRSLAKGVKKLA